MTWEPTDSASSSSSLPKPRFGPSCCYSTYSPSSSVLPSCLTIANRPPFAPRFSLAEPFWAAPDGGWLFICHKAGVVCKPETLCSTTSSLGNSQFRRSWIPLSPPDLNHQLKSLPIESNFGIQAKNTMSRSSSTASGAQALAAPVFPVGVGSQCQQSLPVFLSNARTTPRHIVAPWP